VRLEGLGKSQVKNKAIPVTGRGGLLGCEMLKISHCLHNRLTAGGKVVNPTHRPRSASHKHICLLLVRISVGGSVHPRA
jgi:hypothetical protein